MSGSTNVGSIHYDLGLDTSKFDKAQSGIKSKMGGIASGIAKFGKVFASVGVAAGVFGGLAVKAFSESENVMAQTNAVIKSTGKAAGVTAAQVTKLASSMQSVTKFSDEEIQSGENLLLTFTKIGKDIFPQATQTMLDMSQALGQDTKSSAIQLGKALQDPILGVTALRRVGVNFSSAQQDVIKNLVETGQSAKAQKLILKELNTEFGGSAKAAGSTLSGQLTILKNTFGDLMEKIGAGISAYISPLINKFQKWIEHAGGVDGALKQLGNKWETFKNQLKDNKLVKEIIKSFNSLGDTLEKKVLPAIREMQPLFTTLGKLLAGTFGLSLLGIIKALDFLGNAFAVVVGWVKTAWHWFENNLLPTLTKIYNFIKNQFKKTWDDLKKSFEDIVKAIQPFRGQIEVVLKVLGLLSLFITGILIVAIGVFIAIIGAIILIIVRLVGWVSKLIAWFVTLQAKSQTAAKNMHNAFKDKIGDIVNWFKALPGRIIGALGRLGSTLYNSGKALIQGFINGIKGMWGAMGDTIRNAANTVKDKFKSMLGIHSPSRVFTEYGRNITKGLVNGISEGRKMMDTSIGKLGNSTVSPVLNMATAKSGSNMTINGNINIGNKSDADYFFNRINRNQSLSSLGVAPIGGV